VTTLPVSADGQVIALLCSPLATQGDASLRPLPPTEWHALSRSLHAAGLRPRSLAGLSSGEIREALGVHTELADRLAGLLARGGQLALEVERLSSLGIWIVTRADESYPPTLKRRLGRTAPPVLFGAGPQSNLQLPAIAVVGSRDVAPDGLEFASSLGRCCAEQAFALVSGAARGVDAAAMDGALARGGAAIGVTVDPLERLVRRRELRAAISDELLTLTTPFHPAARWQTGNAMRRNRLVYALSQAAIVVASSTEKGGTRAGALENLKAGWVPLYVRDDGSAGNRQLIDEGGLPLPAREPADWIEVAKLSAVPPDKSPPPIPDPQNSAPPAPDPGEAMDDAFVAVWPILARHLRKPLGEREVAERLKLQLTQARAWLQHAVAEGRAEVKPRPKRYFVREVNETQLRMEETAPRKNRP
jgi:DNA processing protein